MKRNKNEDVINIPFRKTIHAFGNTLTLELPREVVQDREISFQWITLAPGLWNDYNVFLDNETEKELSEKNFDTISMSATMGKNIYGPVFKSTTESYSAKSILMKQISDHFGNNIQPGFLRLPMFMDWTDARYNPAVDGLWDKYMAQMAAEYYGEPLQPKHKGFLPESARLKFANDYQYPTKASKETIESLRYQICLGPNVTATWSTDAQLIEMGFSDEQRPRGKHNKIYMSNPTFREWRIITATDYDTGTFTKDDTLEITAIPTAPFFESIKFTLGMEKSKEYKNASYEPEMKKIFDRMGLFTSMRFSFSYDKTTQKFTFCVPKNKNFDHLQINIDPELASRLGFGSTKKIDASAADAQGCIVGTKVEDNINFKDADVKALTETMDTGVVNILDQNSTSYSTVGMTKKLLATLIPDGLGSMHLEPSFYKYPAPTTRIPNYLISSAPTVELNLLFQKITEENQIVDFDWKYKAVVAGSLRCVKPCDDSEPHRKK